MMMVYILVEEPYHDNSIIHGVYTDFDAGFAALNDGLPECGFYQCSRKGPSGTWNLEHWNDDDLYLYEWDVDANESHRTWRVRFSQNLQLDRKEFVIEEVMA